MKFALQTMNFRLNDERFIQNGLGVMNLNGQANATRNATKAKEFFAMAADQGI